MEKFSLINHRQRVLPRAPLISYSLRATALAFAPLISYSLRADALAFAPLMPCDSK
jgi:hypothetical protein